jgi:CubicO group peptidase (beta-lactamase class C family)
LNFFVLLGMGLYSNSTVARNIDALSQHNIHRVLALISGAFVNEKYFARTDKPMGDWFRKEVSFTPKYLHDLRSKTKTIAALCVGMAVDEGMLATRKEVSSSNTINVGHLLAMSNGLEWNESVSTYGTFFNDETKLFYRSLDAHMVLDLPTIYPPGTHFTIVAAVRLC